MTFTLTPAGGGTASGPAHLAAEMLEEQERLDTRLLASAGGAWTVQARSRNARFLRWLGLDRQITLTLTPDGTGGIIVRAAGGPWLLRCTVFLTGALVACWPLAVTAAVGAVRSRLLVRRTVRLLRRGACLTDGYPV